MKIRHIHMLLDTDNPDDHFRKIASDFGFSSRYFTQYIERGIRAQKIESELWNGIYVKSVGKIYQSPRIEDKGLVCPVDFNLRGYESSTADKSEFFIKMMLDGIMGVPVKYNVPVDSIVQLIEDFRAGGYVNEWLHKRKLLRPHKVHAYLLCSMNTNFFSLRLEIRRKEKVLFGKNILKTEPDEIFFHHKFKDFVLDGNLLKIVDRFDHVLFETKIPTS